MQYREFGKDKRKDNVNGKDKDKVKVSVLGFGCMRLPTDNGKMDGVVDEKESARMIRHAIDAGINYVDTAKVYLSGQSEAILGRILQDGYREKVMIATKLPVWDVKSRKDADRIFDEQRHDLKTEKIDVYLLHNLKRSYWKTCLDCQLIDWALEKKEKGEIDYVGFSFHDDYDFFVEVVNSSEHWDFCQLQYNYTGETVQAGARGLRYAFEKGLSIIIMEPLLGGVLAKPAGKMGELFQSEKGKNFQPVDLAFRWLWDQPEPTVVLSGMSSFEQVTQNLQIANQGFAGTLQPEEKAFILELQKAYNQSMPIKCTKCRYCMPCPSGVDIPLNFEIYNNHTVTLETDKNSMLGKIFYATMLESQQAVNCVRCGSCEESCPQKLPIQEYLAEIDRTLKS
ncbi:MAG: aldo/keto reductase [Planctomycetaceae bacterium]|jgi:predicted aldo/keto reductase-like oxidoreductase|nr:aldo/keto reductase [Planctomycetaceae bacterium]